MRLSRTRSFKVNMGNFEAYEFGATVTMDWEDITAGGALDDTDMPAEERMEMLRTAVVQHLNEQLVEEIEDAAVLTDSEKSFVLELVEPAKPKKNRRPRRA